MKQTNKQTSKKKKNIKEKKYKKQVSKCINTNNSQDELLTDHSFGSLSEVISTAGGGLPSSPILGVSLDAVVVAFSIRGRYLGYGVSCTAPMPLRRGSRSSTCQPRGRIGPCPREAPRMSSSCHRAAPGHQQTIRMQAMPLRTDLRCRRPHPPAEALSRYRR